MSILPELLAYSRDVISGKIIVCQKHRWACMRFLRDIERQGTKDFPYVFDEKKVQRFFDWMRLFKHRKGILKGKNIEPHIIQKFVFGNIYGWKNKKTEYRRFNKFYWQVGRKNAKSQSLACVGTYETMAFSEGEANEIYCAATKTEQAKIVYDEAVAMLIGCKPLKEKYRIAYGRITHLKTGSVMRTLSEEDRKTGDGLNPQCGIIDEYHAHEDSLIYDIIDSGMGARSQPLLGIITTAGFELANPCFRVEYDLVSKILNPDIQVNLDSYFVMINELDKNNTSDAMEINGKKIPPGDLIDDINDENVWEKANPIACSYPEGKEYIRKKLTEAREAPEKMRNFLTKHMDVWVNQRETGYMNMDKWAVCGGELPDLQGKTCFCGLDLSSKLDLTSVGFEFQIEDKYYLFSHSFIPSETLEAKQKTDKVPYGLWISQGWITAIDGPAIDYKTVRDYVIDTAKVRGWTIQEICLDPWGAAQIASDFIEEGFTTVEIVQGIKTLSEPTKNFRELVYQKRIVHDSNPVLSWAISNAVVDTIDRNENIILNKKRSKRRIDPIAALINAHVRAMVAPAPSGGRIFIV